MAVTVRVPMPLRRLTANQAAVSVDAGTIAELVEALEKAHPGMADRLLDEEGAIKRYVNLYVNDEDIRFLQGMDTCLRDGDGISIVPAIAGGRG